jgi:hypothetical protein
MFCDRLDAELDRNVEHAAADTRDNLAKEQIY